MLETTARPAFLEIDLASGPGVALLGSVADQHGAAIAKAAVLVERLFLLRSPWAPGMRFVGGKTKPLTGLAQQTIFDLSGAAQTLEDAFASCIGEAIDRLAQIEYPGDVTMRASIPEVRGRVLSSALPLIDRQLETAGLSALTPLDWVTGKVITPVDCGVAGQDVLLPADWCLRRQAGGGLIAPGPVLSTGVAAGPDYDWAASRALLELVERDAASLWWIGGRRGRPVMLDDASTTKVASLLGSLRQHVCDRRTWLLDITTDLEIPVIAALSCSANGRELACGLAARCHSGDAACAAILELCQIELALLLAACKLSEIGEEGLTPVDRVHLTRARELDVEHCELLRPLVPPVAHRMLNYQSGPAAIAEALTALGIEAALVGLTRPEHGIPVMRAVAPLLQLMPSEIVTARLQQTTTQTGGGARYTCGIALM